MTSSKQAYSRYACLPSIIGIYLKYVVFGIDLSFLWTKQAENKFLILFRFVICLVPTLYKNV